MYIVRGYRLFPTKKKYNSYISKWKERKKNSPPPLALSLISAIALYVYAFNTAVSMDIQWISMVPGKWNRMLLHRFPFSIFFFFISAGRYIRTTKDEANDIDGECYLSCGGRLPGASSRTVSRGWTSRQPVRRRKITFYAFTVDYPPLVDCRGLELEVLQLKVFFFFSSRLRWWAQHKYGEWWKGKGNGGREKKEAKSSEAWPRPCQKPLTLYH